MNNLLEIDIGFGCYEQAAAWKPDFKVIFDNSGVVEEKMIQSRQWMDNSIYGEKQKNDIDFADELEKILSDDSGQEIFVRKKHIIIRKKLSRLATLATVGFDEPPIEEEFEAVCLFNRNTTNDPFVVFRYEIDPVKGFPCEIQYASSSLSCKDEENLVSTIKEVIKYRGLAISEKVRELVNNSNKKEKQ